MLCESWHIFAGYVHIVVVSHEDTSNLDIVNLDIVNFDIVNFDIVNFDIVNLDIVNLDIVLGCDPYHLLPSPR